MVRRERWMVRRGGGWRREGEGLVGSVVEIFSTHILVSAHTCTHPGVCVGGGVYGVCVCL